MSKDSLLLSFQDFIHHSGLVNHGEKIILAVSGGIDSMVLLHLFRSLQPELNLSLAVAHFNHQLRGVESDDDETFIRTTANEHGIECYVEHANTEAIAESKKRSIQETARELRYSFLTQVRTSTGFDKIATAHHADDNAETMLFNMFRGAGVQGLSGIPVFRKDLCVIRPLLFATKEDIQSYAETTRVRYREDSSNASQEYTRNFLRQTLIPQIRENINPNLVAALRRTSELFHALDEYIEHESEKVPQEMFTLKTTEQYTINLPQFHRLQLFLQEYLLQKFAKEFTRSEVDFGMVKMLLNVSHASTGSSCRLGKETTVYKDRDSLVLKKTGAVIPYRHYIQLNHKHDFGAFSFSTGTVDRATLGGNPNVEYVDASLLGSELILRPWQDGDWFVPLGMNEKKKLSDFFVDAKVPVFEKHSIPLFVSDNDIVWVCGQRLDDRYKITEQTHNVVKLEYTPRSHTH